jgi:predicted MFS family arabinose efflux permease
MPGGERARRAAIVLVFVAAYFLSYFYRSTNAVIAGDLARDVGLGPAELGLMTSLFFVAFAAVQLPLGSALDRFGPRFVTSTLLLAAVVGSLVFATAPTFGGLVVGRALIGAGMAGVLMGALKAFSSWFAPRAFATASGLLVGVGSLGALVAATPLALLNEAFGWRAVFAGGAAVTLAVALAVALVVREPRTGPPPAPAGSALGLGAIFRSGPFWRLSAITFAMAGSLFAFQGLWAGPYLVQRMGASPVEAGNVLLAMGLATTAGFLGSGPLAGRFGIARATGAGGLLLIASLASLVALPADWPLWTAALAFAALGLAGSANVLCFALARATFPAMPGRAVTAVNVFGISGGALMQWLLGVVVGRFAPVAGRTPDAAFEAAAALALAVAAVSVIAFWPLVRRAPR